MICCPFHADRNPSMKVDSRFHCFGCGADGDVIDFTAKLFQLSLLQTVEKLAADFGVSATDDFRPFPCNPVEKPNIGLYPVNHSTDAQERINGGCYGKPIHIGKNVWLGGDVKVLAGVTIGDNTIIGTGSIVTKDIPSNVIAVGNPCKVIREITDKDKTEYSKRMRLK